MRGGFCKEAGLDSPGPLHGRCFIALRAERLWRSLSGRRPVAVFPRNAVRGGNGCIEMSYLVGMADRIKASVLQEVGGWGPVKVP